MKSQISFNKLTLTLAALGATSVAAGTVAASPAVSAEETQSAIELGDDDDKKKKKDGDEGGCGAGSCG